MEFESDNHSIFTENLGDVSLKTSLETEITVELSGVPGRTAESFSFFLAPTDGKITIRTSEIARRLLTRHETTVEVIVPNPIYEWGMESRNLPTLKLTAHNASGDAEWSTRVTAGGYGEKEIGDETEFLTHNFLTWRPQISITYPGLKEQLTFIDPTEGVFRAMRLRMYFGKELPTDETIVRSSGIGLRRIDVSPAAVSALAVYRGIDDVLTAYDLYGIANEAPGMRHGTRLSPSDSLSDGGTCGRLRFSSRIPSGDSTRLRPKEYAAANRRGKRYRLPTDGRRRCWKRVLPTHGR